MAACLAQSWWLRVGGTAWSREKEDGQPCDKGQAAHWDAAFVSRVFLSHRNFFFLFPGVLILDIDVFLTIRSVAGTVESVLFHLRLAGDVGRQACLIRWQSCDGTPSPHQHTDSEKALCCAKKWPLADANEVRFSKFSLSLAAANIATALTRKPSELSHRLSDHNAPAIHVSRLGFLLPETMLSTSAGLRGCLATRCLACISSVTQVLNT